MKKILCGGGGQKFDISVFDENLSPFCIDERVIKNLNEIDMSGFHFVFVCVSDKEVALKVKDKLSSMGVREEQIRWVRNYFYHNRIYKTLECDKGYVDQWQSGDFENLEFNEMLERCKDDFVGYSHYYFIKNFKYSLTDTMETGERDILKYNLDKAIKQPLIAIAFSLGRSGTTLMSQWLASLRLFAYPPNLLQTNHYTPLMNFAYYKNLVSNFSVTSSSDFTSDFGNTRGIFSEYEFLFSDFFIGTNLTNFNIGDLTEEILQDAKAYFASFGDILQKPLSMKVRPQGVEFCEKICNDVLYIVLKRDIYTHVLALVNMYNSFSLPMSGYSEFNKSKVEFQKEPIRYAAITLKNALILRERNLKQVSNDRKIEISYEDFCKNPKELYDKLLKQLSKMGYSYDLDYKGIESFKVSDRKADKETIKIVDEVFANDAYNIDFGGK